MAKAPKSFSEVARGYKNLWNTTELVKRQAAIHVADRILQCIPQYEAITKATGVPGWVIGIIHYREANLNFRTYLGNGQPLSKKTTIVPKGRGPFSTFTEGAIDALKMEDFDKIRDWSAARFLYESERFNGFGYYARGVNSPYVWGGTNHQQKGKFVRDGVFDPNVMDTQLGSAAILKALCERSITINAQVNPDKPAAMIVLERTMPCLPKPQP
jgi:lysozyme family protein